MKARYLTDDEGNKVSVVIPLDEYKQMLADLEELEDIATYEEAKARTEEESIPLEEYLANRKAAKHG